MSNKELIYAWKLSIFENTPLVQETIAALETADRDVLHGKMKHDRKCEEIAALKAQLAAPQAMKEQTP